MRAIGTAICIAFLVLAGNEELFAAPFGFVPGHYYTTHGYYSPAVIDEFDASGQLVASLFVPGVSDLSGIRFGPDQKLYVVGTTWVSSDVKTEVLAINANGAIEQRYESPSVSSANQFAFGDDGHFYLGHVRFRFGEADSGEAFLPSGRLGIVTLPSGNLLAADRLAIYELSTSGKIIRKVFDVQPLGGSEIRSLAFDVESNSIYTNLVRDEYELVNIDFTTGSVLNVKELPNLGTDLFLTREQMLLAGSFSAPPQLLNLNLESTLTFNSPWQYGTQFVPEPATYILALTGLASLFAIRSRRTSKRSRVNDTQ